MHPDTKDTEAERSVELHPAELPPVGFGVASASLGLVGLMLFWLPILGGQISAWGLVIGGIGVAAALPGRGDLRWCLRGIGLCLLALAFNVLMYFAPESYLPDRGASRMSERVQTLREIPPPAPP